MLGLVESYTHLGLNNTDDIIRLGALPPEEHTLLAMENAKLYLDHGFTSCISAGSLKPRLDVVMRNAINAERIPGPRLLAATPWLTVTGGLIAMNLYHKRRDAIAIVLDCPENYRHVIRELIRAGFLADLPLVSGNPLENVRLLQNPANFVAVVKDDKFHKIEEELRQRSRLAYTGS